MVLFRHLNLKFDLFDNFPTLFIILLELLTAIVTNYKIYL